MEWIIDTLTSPVPLWVTGLAGLFASLITTALNRIFVDGKP